MTERSPEISSSRAIPVVRLASLPDLAAELVARVRAGGFEPEAIVYVETGARLLAHEMSAALGVAMLPIWIRRSGQGVKQKLAPLVARLPVGVRDWLRRIEEGSGMHRLTRRKAALPTTAGLRGRRILIVDDASDTGRTVTAARELVLAQGAQPADVRTAVLAATTPRAHAVVDFFLFDRNCRMPWSADSDEFVEAGVRAAKLAPAHAPRTF